MKYHFYAYMARMKFIKRWSLRRNTHDENVQEHTLQVVMISHALAAICNKRYSGSIDVEKVLLMATYHEAAEVITGDMPTPIKYFNPGIREAFKNIEHIASDKLLEYLPDDMKDDFEKIIKPDENTHEWRIVKAADRISAYIKCLEEEAYGNHDFNDAKNNVLKSIMDMHLPEAEDFMYEFVPSFADSLDALN